MHPRLLSLLLLPALLLSALPAHAAPDRSLIKSSDNAAVYYLTGGKRYAFPNEKVFFSWYADFSNVVTVSSVELAGYSLGGNVTYRPGVRLVKIQTDPKVYAVSRYGTLRWITSEAIASSLYGQAWNALVHDVPDAFFVNYTIGSPVYAASDYDRSGESSIAAIADNISASLGSQTPITQTPSTPSGSVASVGGCTIFPADNPWNKDVSQSPLHSKSYTYINSIGASTGLHADFGETQTYGIPINVVPQSQAMVPIAYDAYGDESDPGPYPIPPTAQIEASSDHHILVLQQGACKLYELFAAHKDPNGAGWIAASGAVWDLKSNALRPYGWTSADAAGLPILPGLVRYDEVAAGAINHAIRFTASRTQKGYILPATHHAGSNNPDYPPMGLRVRMKANYDISGLTGQARVIAMAMKTYGMILADNGSNWYFTGATDPRWNDDELNQLKNVPGSAFEVVDTGEILQ